MPQPFVVASVVLRIRRNDRHIDQYLFTLSSHPSWSRSDLLQLYQPQSSIQRSPWPRYIATLQPAHFGNYPTPSAATIIDLPLSWRPVIGHLHDDIIISPDPDIFEEGDDAWHLRGTPPPTDLTEPLTGPSPRTFRPLPVNTSFILRLPIAKTSRIFRPPIRPL